MKRNLLLFTLFGATALTSYAQNNRYVYAVTDTKQEGYGWNMLRKFDLKEEKMGNVLVNGTDYNGVAYDAKTKQAITEHPKDAKYGNQYYKPAFSTGVAATGFDARSNRLFFAPMRIDQLRFVDLDDNKVYHVQDQTLTGVGNFTNDEGKVITRMAIDDEGVGYALSNDGSQFVSFTARKEVKITKLAALTDAPENASKNISVKNQATSWGGDMVADQNGNLYLISMRNHVFKINVKTSVATYLGAILGLPEKFTTNGAAVLFGGYEVMISSANFTGGYYVIDLGSLEAYFIMAEGTKTYHVSDLASPYVIKYYSDFGNINSYQLDPAKNLTVFPNPIKKENASFKVQIKNAPDGEYIVEVTDLQGKNLVSKKVGVNMKNQQFDVQVDQQLTSGLYLVYVKNSKREIISQTKLVVE
jgi:hypothetical protein